MKLSEAIRFKKEVSCSEAVAEPNTPILLYMKEHPGMTRQEAEKQLDGVVICKEKARLIRPKEKLTTEELEELISNGVFTCYIANQSHCPLGKGKR